MHLKMLSGMQCQYTCVELLRTRVWIEAALGNLQVHQGVRKTAETTHSCVLHMLHRYMIVPNTGTDLNFKRPLTEYDLFSTKTSSIPQNCNNLLLCRVVKQHQNYRHVSIITLYSYLLPVIFRWRKRGRPPLPRKTTVLSYILCKV